MYCANWRCSGPSSCSQREILTCFHILSTVYAMPIVIIRWMNVADMAMKGCPGMGGE